MAKTVVGLFDTYDSAQNTVQELLDQGISANDISVVANNARGELTQTTGSERAVAEGAGAGAVGGTVVGGVLGLLVGLGALAIPGIGPVIAAGPLSAAIGSTAAAVGAGALGAGLGAASGGLLGALIGSGVPEEDASFYSEGVRRGGTLVSVSITDAKANTAQAIMQRNGVIDIDERSGAWRQSGWDRFDPNAEPYTHDQVAGYTTARTGATSTGSRVYDSTATPRTGEGMGEQWQESSKAGTAAGTATGAATGAAIGAAGGPVGAVIGGVAGAVTGGGVGAAGDVAGETAEDRGDFDRDYFRNDYNSTYAGSGYGYEQYEPAYRYGYDLSRDPMYRGRTWYDIENDVRSGWDADRYGPWDRFKDAVRRGWERTKDAAR